MNVFVPFSVFCEEIFLKNFISLEFYYFFTVVKYLFKAKKVKLRYRCSVKRAVLSGWNVISSGAYVIDSSLGRHSYVGLDSIVNNAEIGAFTCIGPKVIVGIGMHPTNRLSIHPAFYSIRRQSGFSFCKQNSYQEHERTLIGNDVWIGAGVIIKDGLTIGDGAILGAGSVVTKDVQEYSIVGGVPAREIRKRLTKDLREQALSDPWWEKPDEELSLRLAEFEIEYDDD